MTFSSSLHYGNISEFIEWRSDSLKNISPLEVQLKNTFECIDLTDKINPLKEQLVAFLKSFDLLDVGVDFRCSIGVPDYITRAFSFVSDDTELAILLSDSTVNYLNTVFSTPRVSNLDLESDKQHSESALTKVALEYFILKIIRGFSDSFRNVIDSCAYMGEISVSEMRDHPTEMMQIILLTKSGEFVIDVLLPPTVSARLRKTPVMKLPFSSSMNEMIKAGEGFHRLLVPVLSFFVEPSLLIDYLQPDAIIVLNCSALPSLCPVYIDQKEEAFAYVKRSENCFLIQFQEGKMESANNHVVSTKYTSVQLAFVDERIELSDLSLSPRYYKTKTAVSSQVHLEIGGEIVGKGILGFVDGKLSVKVLST